MILCHPAEIVFTAAGSKDHATGLSRVRHMYCVGGRDSNQQEPVHEKARLPEVVVRSDCQAWRSAPRRRRLNAQSTAGTLRVAMTAGDMPLTTGQPSQGGEGLRFMGITVYDGLDALGSLQGREGGHHYSRSCRKLVGEGPIRRSGPSSCGKGVQIP